MDIATTRPIQGRSTTAWKPSARSALIDGCSIGTARAGSRIDSSVARLTAKVAASTQSATRVPPVAISRPPSAGPTTKAACGVRDVSALPDSSSSLGSSVGTSAR